MVVFPSDEYTLDCFVVLQAAQAVLLAKTLVISNNQAVDTPRAPLGARGVYCTPWMK